MVDDLDSHLTEELEMINQYFSVSNNSEKIMLLKRLRELVTPATSYLIEPKVKIRRRNKCAPKTKHQLVVYHLSSSWWNLHMKIVDIESLQICLILGRIDGLK